MSLKDKLGAILGKKGPEARKTTGGTPEQAPDFYSGVKKADEELFLAATHMKSLADDILAASSRRPPDPASLVEQIDASCSKSATDWLNSQYKLPAFLADAYGKSWADTPVAKEMLISVCKASSISDSQVASSLKEGLRLIAVAAAAMLVHGLYSMARNPDTETATRNANATAAAAKTYILGL